MLPQIERFLKELIVLCFTVYAKQAYKLNPNSPPMCVRVGWTLESGLDL